MTQPAGPCEWCGGPQNWTIHAGEMYVRCQAGCQSLFGAERVTLPLDSDEPLVGCGLEGTLEGEEGVPCEGGSAVEDPEGIDAVIVEPPVGWLSTLWEGGWDG